MGNNLKALRAAAGLSQRKLAVAAGVHWRSIQQWESGERQLSDIYILRRLAAALGCAVDDLAPPED